MWKLVEKIIDDLPPSIRHGVSFTVIGAAMMLGFMAFSGRIAAAEREMTILKQAQEQTSKDVKDLTKSMTELVGAVSMTNSNVALQNQQIQTQRENLERMQRQFERIEDKLDRSLGLPATRGR